MYPVIVVLFVVKLLFPKMAQKEYLEILKIQVGNGIFQMNGSGVTHI